MAILFNKQKKKKLLALALSATMVLSTVAGFVACNGDGSNGGNSDSNNTTTETDTARIKNGSFEFYDDNDGKNLIVTTIDNWKLQKNTYSPQTTPNAKTASGIINTNADSWANLTESSLLENAGIDPDELTVAQAEKYWSQMSSYDKLKFYKTWEDLDDDNDPEDLSFYDADTDNFNIKAADIPACENPLTHDYNPNATPSEDEDVKESVLMLHNNQTNHQGTAYNFTSSTSVTIAAGTSAKVSVWVKTSDLTFADSYGVKQTVQGNRGAYIGITHTVGGQTLDQFQVKNIDTSATNPKPATEGETWENNGWVQYTFYLRGCDYANSTFTMVLGLGQADGTELEFVNGYAFFDDLECTLISNVDYEKAQTNNTAKPDDDLPTANIDQTGDDKVFLADEKVGISSMSAFGKTEFALDLYAGFENYYIKGKTGETKISLTEETQNGVTYVAADDSSISDDYKNAFIAGTRKVYGPLGTGFDTSKDTYGVFSYDDLKKTANLNNDDPKDDVFPLSGILEKDFAHLNKLTGNTDDILMILSVDGANYTATITDPNFSLKAGQKMAISFFLKTSPLKGSDKVNLYLVDDYGKETVLSTLDASNTQPVDIDGEGDDKKDIYDGWQQCFFFVNNDSDQDNLKFSLKVTFGSKTIVGTSKDSYHSGYVALTGFQIRSEMSKTQFNCISTGTYAGNAILKGEKEATSNDTFDTPMHLPTNAIETGIANPINYKGVTGGSGYVNNTSTDLSYNTNPYAGLINKNYIENYLGSYWANQLNLKDEAALETFFDGSTQPLLIYNNEEQAYGFIGQKQTIAANSAPTAISLRIKASAGATVNVYLADMDDYKHESILSVGRRLTYWYDEYGNVCISDPTDSKFKPSEGVAFKLQSNGLYTATEKGLTYDNVEENTYYFNLNNYEVDKKTKNLLVKEGGVSYNYTNAWKHDGNDGIAFYYNDGSNGKPEGYYADSKYTVPVKNLADTAVPTRYTAVENESLAMTITGNDTWQTVTFYVTTGSVAKNYRLEIWSGSRDGSVKNGAKSYVLIGNNTVSSKDDLSATITEYIEDVLGYADEDEFKNGNDDQTIPAYADVFYSAYSFYDSDTFLRYDQSLDKNKVDNSYDDYPKTANETYTEGIAYFKAVKTIESGSELLDVDHVLFADYSLSEQTPAVDSNIVNDTPEEEETETDDNGADVWLLASSLLIAVVLLLAVVALVVRKVLSKIRKKKARVAVAAQTKSVKNRRYSPKKNDDK